SDVSSVDATVKSIYGVISGSAGPRNWNRFHSLFLPGAKMGMAVARPDGSTVFRSFTPAEYQRNNGSRFTQSGFFEEELGRQVTQFGNLAHVQSAYQYRFSQGGNVEKRGVNYFTLVKSEDRWWIAEIVWQEEGANNPIPASLLRQQ
ncbi:MAG: hypothetical protein M3Q06_12185, partial [Bacteroidota bacterium]|nr:hypothetical protein [Bacteroidota bacterium]